MIITNEEFAYKKWLKDNNKRLDMYTELWLSCIDMFVPKIKVECKIYVFPAKEEFKL